MALRTATLKDGATTTHIKFGSAASLLQKLKTKGWNPEQGDVVKLPGDFEVLAEDDIPEVGDLSLELVRQTPQALDKFKEEMRFMIGDSRRVVSVEALDQLRRSVFFIRVDGRSSEGTGVGVFVGPKTAVTANHCLPKKAKKGSFVYARVPKFKASDSTLSMSEDESIRLKVVERYENHDYAVLSYEKAHAHLSVYTGDANVLIGQTLGMCAYQFGIQGELKDEFPCASLGVMPAQGIKLSANQDFLVYTSQTWPGDSGGALVMQGGELVGLHLDGVNHIKELAEHEDGDLENRVSALEASVKDAIASVSTGCVAVLARKFMQGIS